MSALTSIFNFLYVYLRYFVALVFGGTFGIRYFSNVEQQDICRSIIISLSNGSFDKTITFSGEPLFILILGIFVLGSIIGLVRRLMR